MKLPASIPDGGAALSCHVGRCRIRPNEPLHAGRIDLPYVDRTSTITRDRWCDLGARHGRSRRIEIYGDGLWIYQARADKPRSFGGVYYINSARYRRRADREAAIDAQRITARG